jgi:hypothetical protein
VTKNAFFYGGKATFEFASNNFIDFLQKMAWLWIIHAASLWSFTAAVEVSGYSGAALADLVVGLPGEPSEPDPVVTRQFSGYLTGSLHDII